MKTINNLIKKLLNKPSKAKLLITSIATIGVLVTSAIALAGWTPGRPVFDWNNPDDRKGSLTGPVFNSFINTPYYGDERAFLDASRTDQATQPNAFKDVLPNVTKGSKEVILRTYVHNNANQSTNDAQHDHIGIARNTKVRITLPTGTETALRARSYITADNATPAEVTDTAELVDSSPFAIQYIPGSAVIYNSAHNGGVKLGDGIVGSGVQIGYENMNGNLPGCFEYQAIVEIRVKILTPDLKVEKQVRKPGETAWHKSVDAKPGETVQWLVKVTNTGDTVQHNVVASDLLPPHVSYVADSAKWYSASQNGVPYNFNQFIVNEGKGGYVFGNYAANGGGFLVRFDTKVKGDFDPCSIAIRNIGHAKSTENPGEISDYADVKITKENCTPTKPAYSCDSLGAKLVSDKTYEFTAKASATGGAKIKHYTYDFGDKTAKLVTDKNVVKHTYAGPGDYVVSVKVEVVVDGKSKVITSESCKTHISIGTTTTTTTTTTTVPGGKLADTGPGDVAGIFTGTSLMGMFLHRRWTLRRIGKKQ